MDSGEKASEKASEKTSVKEENFPVISDYCKSLEEHVKRRYLQKISAIGVDPAVIGAGANLDTECLPPIESMDIFSYLVLETSFYTKEQFKNFKSLEAHKWLTSGFVISVQGCVIAEKFVVLGKVKHSQRMNDPAISTWIIASKEGTVLSAHCMDCKAGLGESCSHVASILFYIEAWARIHEKLACTQVKCSWLLPKGMNDVPYSRVRDINFKSVSALKARLDNKIDSLTVNESSMRSVFQPDLGSSVSAPHSNVQAPTVSEISGLYEKLNDCKVKPVALSVVSPYSKQFILPSRNIPSIPELFDPSNLDLSYPDLLKECFEVKLTLSDDQRSQIEKDTRDQANGGAFFRHRAGRIGASMSGAVCHSNPDLPSQSLIKQVCYPSLFQVTTKAVMHGRKHEALAIAAYEQHMKQHHENFRITQCGLFINKDLPFLHATPDFLTSCSCCGDGCGEVKCPISIENCDFVHYCKKDSSCLEMKEGKLCLKRSHNYFYQVQQQLSTCHRNHNDFVVCAFDGQDKAVFVFERIYPDPDHWEKVVPKLTDFWKKCILPEIIARWYTRKCHIPEILPDDGSICYCRKNDKEKTVICSNKDCPYLAFHQSCLAITGPLPKNWYCPHCRKLPQFKKGKGQRVEKQVKGTVNEVVQRAITLDKVCTCQARPQPSDRLLECHSVNCQNGQYFHPKCLGYKRMPSNGKTTWVCHGCKANKVPLSPAQGNTSEAPTTCSSLSADNTDNGSGTGNVNLELDDDCTITGISEAPTSCSSLSTDNTDNDSSTGNVNLESDKDCTITEISEAPTTRSSLSADNTDSGSSSGNVNLELDKDCTITGIFESNSERMKPLKKLDASDCANILTKDYWLDCDIIQNAHVCLQKVNPLIEGFQRPTLGPVRNFNIASSEFVQILHTGNAHWVCVSSVGCLPGSVNLYDSMFHDVIELEVEEQVQDLLAESFIGINTVPVQQQLNGSDCGVFAIAFATCIVYGIKPEDVTFDIPKMRPHLVECLRSNLIVPFPVI